MYTLKNIESTYNVEYQEKKMSELTIYLNDNDVSQKMSEATRKLITALLSVHDVSSDAVLNSLGMKVEVKDNVEVITRTADYDDRKAYADLFAQNGAPSDVFKCVSKGKAGEGFRIITGVGTRAVLAKRMQLAFDFESWRTVITSETEGNVKKGDDKKVEKKVLDLI